MKKLVLGSLIALVASQAAGCVISSDSDAYVTASWTVKNIATNTITGCPPDHQTVALYNQEVDSLGNSIGSPFIDLYDCSRGAATSAGLPPALYLTWLEITNDTNTSTYAQSTSAYVDLLVSDKSFSAEILNDGGYFQFAWDLRDANTNASLSCAQAGAAGGVESIATDVADPQNAFSDQFDCEDFSGITSGFRAANYTVSVAALNASEQAIGMAPTLTNRGINIRNAVTQLGTITIPID